MNKKGHTVFWIALIILAILVVAGFWYYETHKPATAGHNAGLQTYNNQQFGVEINYPQSWYSYGDKSSFSNLDLLSWRGFVPDYDANKSLEQQAFLQLSIFDKNASSSFDAPKRFIVNTNPSEIWEQVTVNGYTGTKITDITTNKITAYVFEKDGKLYVFDASQPGLFDIVLPTLKFF